MKFKLPIFLSVFIALWVTSCTSYKNVPYFQDMKVDSVFNEKIINFTPFTVQPGDLLAINVNSLNRDEDNKINYNLERQNGSSTVSVDRPGENAVIGYLVDHDGNIKLPFINKVKVGGLTTSQVSDLLESNLSTYLSKPVVTVRMQNFKISVLGDVKNPGTFYFSNERVAITEALSQAGDLNTTGIRENVLLIREIDGVRKYIKIDLRSKNTITSNYYYLKNNDVLYVTPNKEKVWASDSSLQKYSILLSALSIIAIFVTRVK